MAFAPLFGLAYLMAASWWTYRLGHPLDGRIVSLIVLPALSLTLWFLFSPPTRRTPPLSFVTRRWLVFGGIWLLALIILALPLLFNPSALIVTLGNNDVAHHSAISRFLMEQSRDHPVGFPGQYPRAFVWFADNTFFGYYSVLANVAALSNRLPHEVVSALLCGVAALNTGPVYLLARRAVGAERRSALVWSVLGVGHALSLYILYHGFGGQIFGTLFGFALLYLLVIEPYPVWNSPAALRHATVIGVMVIGLILSYPHMLPFVLALAGVWRGVTGIVTGSLGKLPRWIASGLVGGLICVLVIPNRFWAFYLWIKQAASDQSGWPVRFLWPDYLLGLIGTQMDQAHVAVPQNFFRIGILLALAALLGHQLSLGGQKNRRLLAALAGLGAIYAGAVGFAFLEGGEEFGGYKSFKLLTFFDALPAVIVAACWTGLGRRGNVGRICAGLFFAGYLGVWGVGLSAMVHGDGRGNVLTAEDGKLADAARRGGFKSVNLVTEDYWESMWLAYFFLDKQVYPAYRSYYPPADLKGEVSFIRPSSRWAFTPAGPGAKTSFGLNFSSSPQLFACYLGQGWHGPEADHEWMGAAGADADILIFASSEVHAIAAVVRLQPFLPDNACTVLWNDEIVERDLTGDTLVLRLGKVLPGKNVLRLRSKLPPAQPGNGDVRPICFGLRRIELRISD